MKSTFIALMLLIACSVSGQHTINLSFKSLDEGFDTGNLKYIRASRSSVDTYTFMLQGYNSVLYTPVVKVSAKRFKSIVPDGIKSYVALADFTRDSDFQLNLPENKEIKLPDNNGAIAANLTATRSKLNQVSEDLHNTDIQIRSVDSRIKTNKYNILKIPQADTFSLGKEKSQLIFKRFDLESEKVKLECEIAKLELQQARVIPPVYNTIDNFNTEYQNLFEFEEVLTKLGKALESSRADHQQCKILRDAAYAALSLRYSITGTDLPRLQKKFYESLNTCTALRESLSLQVASGSVGSDRAVQAAIDNALIASEDVSAKRLDLSNAVKLFVALFPESEFKKSSKYLHKKDYALLSIKLVKNLNPKDTILRQEVKILSKGGWDFDFSIGMVYDDIYKRSWFVDTTGAGSIKEEKVFSGDFTWAALINLSNRLGPKDRAGISVGPGISLIDGGARYLLGVHYYHGARDIVGISAGLCIGKRNFLPAIASENGTRPLANLPDALTAVTPYEKFTTGFYVGLFYNFSRL